MDKYITRIRTEDGDLQIDYGALANLPTNIINNILDNSDFRNPVNRNDMMVYDEYVSKYTIDRWKTYCKVEVKDGYITFTNLSKSDSTNPANNIYQYFETGTIVPGKKYTAVCKLTDGTLWVGSGTVSDGKYNKIFTSSDKRYGMQIAANYNGSDHFAIRTELSGITLDIEWVALFEGEYTMDTLPEYRPKGYAYEYLICSQYSPVSGEYIGDEKHSQTYNMLDNSDFSNPVNHIGMTEYPLNVTKYTIDRWSTYGSVIIKDGYIRFKTTGTTYLYQYFKPGTIIPGKTYTMACCMNDGNVYVASGCAEDGKSLAFNVFSDNNETSFRLASNYVKTNETEPTNFFAFCHNKASGVEKISDIKWLALYEGEYNQSTLPEYVPKGYENEILTCGQYDPVSGEYIGLNNFGHYNNSAKFYFPSLESGTNACSSAIMTVGGKCVLFDCGASTEWNLIKNYYSDLKKNGVFTNIDAIVISHYHYDHVENLENILTTFKPKYCKVYLPMNPSNYFIGASSGSGSVDSYYENVTSVLQIYKDNLEPECNFDYIEVAEDTTIELVPGFCTMDLFNSNDVDYAYYKDNSAGYNNYSMCALIRTGDVYSMFPGDIEKIAQQRIADTRVLPRLIVYPIHHHGFEKEDSQKYINMICPEYGVISTTHNRMILNGNTDSMLANYATKNLYSTGYGKCEFIVGSHGGSVVHGKELTQCGWNYDYFNFYVDNEYVGPIYDGTIEHPFTNINECLMFINDNKQSDFTIHIKGTNTVYSPIWCRNVPKEITFTSYGDNKPRIAEAYIGGSNNVVLDNLIFEGIGRDFNDDNKIKNLRLIYTVNSNLKITNCEINHVGNVYTQGLSVVEFAAALYANGSNLMINNCNFRGETQSDDDVRHKAIYCTNNTNIHMVNCSMTKFYYGVYSGRKSEVVVDTIKFSDITRCYYLKDLDLHIVGEDEVVYVESDGKKTPTVTHYVYGEVGSGVQYRLTTRAKESKFDELVILNSTSAVSYPFYYQGRSGTNLCIAMGSNIYGLGTSGEEGSNESFTILNNKKINTYDIESKKVNLIYVSDLDNLVIGSSNNPKNTIVYCKEFDVRNYIKLNSESYGSKFPTENLTEGRLFFKKV